MKWTRWYSLCSKWTLFCNASYDKIHIVMRVAFFTLNETIAKFIISIYVIPVLHAFSFLFFCIFLFYLLTLA